MAHIQNVASSVSGILQATTMMEHRPWQDQLVLASRDFRHLACEMDESIGTLWCSMTDGERPSYTPGLLADMACVQTAVRNGLRMQAPGSSQAVRTLVIGSSIPGIYNLGGDLPLFAAAIRQQDRAALTRYAHSCVDTVFNNSDGYGGGVTTIALVQGQALGGGFEAVLSCHVIVAERSARFGLPEVLFNLFPGMGAYSFLSRRLTPVAAERMILSGKIYSAVELYEMGLVDVLVDDGCGVAAVRKHIVETERRTNSRKALRAVRDVVHPVTREELLNVTEIWVETALALSETDLRHMQLLVRAQARRSPKAAPAPMQMAAE